jgi:hypothetical protein
MRKLKRTFYLILFFLTVSTMSPALAQAPGYTAPSPFPSYSQPSNPGLDAAYSNVDPNVPRNLNTLTQSTFISVLSSSVCILSGYDPLNPNGTCLGTNPLTGNIGYAKSSGGAAQFMGSLIGSTFTIPVSSGAYANYALNNFGLTKNAYAQNTTDQNGSGFASLIPLVKVWSRFRDIAYLAFVLAFTLIGLAIMFRVKIDARTVMTIQNQIPKIVIALLLVTFSYAIAGFLIDMMYVAMYFIILTFSTLTPAHISTNSSVFSVVNKAFTPGIYDPGVSGTMSLTFQMSKGISEVFSSLTTDFLNSTIGALFRIPFIPFDSLKLGCDVFSFVGHWTVGLPATLVGKIPGVGGVLKSLPGGDFIFGGGSACDFSKNLFELTMAFIFGAIVFLVVLIAILYSLFRVWFTLIKSFVYVLVDSMIGPLWIGAGIFPGSKLSFTTWVRHLMGHLSVFPMTFAVILLGKTIMDGVASGQGELFSPPLVGDSISGNTFLAAIIGFGFILSLPGILDKTRKVVGALDFGLTDVKSSLGAGIAAPKKGFSEYGELAKEKRTPEVNPETGQWRRLEWKDVFRRRFGGTK